MRIRRGAALVSMAIRLLVLSAAFAALICPVAQAQEAPAAGGATISVSDGAKTIGEQLDVGGSGWEPFTTLSAAVCGNQGFNGSADCVSLGRSFLSQSDGSVSFADVLARPPSACPCVVRVREMSGEIEATTPIDIVGLETVGSPAVSPAPASGVTAVLSVEEVSVSDGGWKAWFGLPTERTVKVVVTNRSANPVDRPPFSASWGRGAGGTEIVSTSPIDTIAPGETVVLEATFSQDPLAYGSYQVNGRVGPSWGPERFVGFFDTWPWALLVLVLVVVVLLVARQVRRRRSARRPPVGPGTGGADAAGSTVPALPGVPAASATRSGRVDGELLSRLEVTLSAELQRALTSVCDECGDRDLTDEEALAQVARVAHRTSIACSRQHRLDPDTTRNLITHLFTELCDRLSLVQLRAGGLQLPGQTPAIRDVHSF